VDTITPETPPRINLVRLHKKSASTSQRMPRSTVFALPQQSASSPTPYAHSLQDMSRDGDIFDDSMSFASGKRHRDSTLNDSRSSSPSPEPAAKRARQDLPPPVAVTAEASSGDKPKKVEPPFADNYTPGSKSKASDYAPSAEAVILRAARHYECKVLAEEAFPQVAVRSESAKETFKTANKLFKENFKITDRIITLVSILAFYIHSFNVHQISRRGSRIRGSLLTDIRGEITSGYGFKNSTGKKAIDANAELYKMLEKGNAFMYKVRS
jgi:hypothetical protein